MTSSPRFNSTPPLGYCTNVHPGPGLDRSLRAILETAPEVRRRLAGDAPLAIGLWLSSEAAASLEPEGLAEGIRDRLAEQGLLVAGLNGFPFGDFHGRIVKHAVYEPHWADPQRVEFTRRLANLLPRLVPAGTSSAGVTTLPIGWRTTFADEAAMQAARKGLASLVPALREIHDRTGVLIHIDVEPEPGCRLERADETASFLAEAIDEAGGEAARPHLRACHDVCHASVLFEEQAESIDAYRDAGVLIGRVQISNAVAFDGVGGDFRSLRPFEEPRWLHQTAVLSGDGTVRFFEDLPAALESAPEGLWRIHFHVPVFAERLGGVGTTRDDIAACLDAIGPEDGCDFLEVETYAWSALPAAMRPGSLEEGIADELRFVRGVLDAVAE